MPESTAPSTNPLRIVGLRVSNFKRVVAVALTPDGRSVVVGGRNAQGKSSLLDAIADALGGARRGSHTDLPLRTGSVKGEVRVDLGELVVTRSWTPTSDKLVVESPPGSPVKSPQAVLDRLVGDLSFDPLAFSREAPAKQAETLRRLSGLDTRETDAKRATAYDARTSINGRLKRSRAIRDEVVVPDEPPPPPARPSVTALLERQRQIAAERAAAMTAAGVPESCRIASRSLEAEIVTLDESIASTVNNITVTDGVSRTLDEAGKLIDAAHREPLPGTVSVALAALMREMDGRHAAVKQYAHAARAELAEATAMKNERTEALAEWSRALAHAEAAAPLPGVIDALDADLAAVKAALADADRASERAAEAERLLAAWQAARAEYQRRQTEVEQLEGEARRLSTMIEDCDEAKQRALGAARFPVDGLGIDGDVVTFQRVPFAQASGAEKVRVGFAIAAALNPQLRVALVREGAALDDESLAAVLDAAKAGGFQVWIETVGERDSGEGVGVIIEDGRIGQRKAKATTDAPTTTQE